MEKDNSHTSGFDFEAYTRGTMRVADQHRFEKAMLNDPLLADAYEGFLAQVDSDAEPGVPSDALKSMLTKRINQSKNKMPLWYYVAAASVLLLIGFAVALDGLQKGTSKADRAVVKGADSVTVQAAATESESFSATPPSPGPSGNTKRSPESEIVISTNGIDNLEVESKKEVAAIKSDESVSLSLPIDTMKPHINLAEALASQTQRGGEEQIVPASRAFSPSVAANARKRVENLIQGKVLNASGDPLPGVVVQNKRGKESVTDASGRYTIEADQGDSLSFAYVGFKPVTVSVAAAESVLLNEEVQALSEVVIVGYGEAKKSNRGASVEPGPNNGWVAYRHYLDQQAKIWKLKEQVIVRFELDRAGRPINLIADKAGELGEIAKRIVVEGVRWNPEKSKKILSVTVPAGQ